MKFKDLFNNNMYKIGPDEFNRFLICSCLLILVIKIFITSFFVDIVLIMFFAVLIYRLFSKDKYKIYKQNDEYIEFKNKVLKPFNYIKLKYKNRKNYIYKKCHKCKKILRLKLPDKIGIKHVNCPTCNKRNTYIILKKSKVK